MKRRFSSVGGLFVVLAMLLGIGWACSSAPGGPFVTQADFDAYKQAIADDGAEIEQWAKSAQAWMDAMVAWARQQHPTGDTPPPPSPGPCQAQGNACPWGTQ
jgi:hypothetical protein